MDLSSIFDVLKDLPGTCRTIARFLGRTLTDDQVARICDHCSVDNMRNNDMVNLSYWKTIKKTNSVGGFINKGNITHFYIIEMPLFCMYSNHRPPE